jgi:hypothetical protein
MYQDESLTCVDCGRPFPFTTGEQEFYASKGFTNKPSRWRGRRGSVPAPGRQAGLLPRLLHPTGRRSLDLNRR